MKKKSIGWSHHLIKYTFCVFILICLPGNCHCYDFTIGPDQTDTISRDKQNSSLQILKFNPGQIFFGEIPVSWEVLRNKSESIQFQVGILIPYVRKLPNFIGSMLPPPSSHVISLRTMPYINYGISSKIELRKYLGKGYFALQGMYKYSAYSNMTFTIWDSNATFETYDQIESKKSHTLGIGIMIGKQTYTDSEVRELYCGLGLRLRILSGVIEADYFPNPVGRIEKNTPFNYNSTYPFINLGMRFGKTFP